MPRSHNITPRKSYRIVEYSIEFSFIIRYKFDSLKWEIRFNKFDRIISNRTNSMIR
jgi:hypothetical protein